MRPMISRQEFLRGAVGALAAGAMFGTGRAGADPASGWTGLSSSIGGKVLLPPGRWHLLLNGASAGYVLQKFPAAKLVDKQPLRVF